MARNSVGASMAAWRRRMAATALLHGAQQLVPQISMKMKKASQHENSGSMAA